MNKIHRVESDGLELAVESFGAGPPLVFAHGLTGNRSNTRDQFAALADRYRITIFDQRGHGDSTPVTDPVLYDSQRMAGDMAAIMDALDIERAIVGGESMGAATALLFALKWPQRVETLLLTAPAFGDVLNAGLDGIRDMGDVVASEGIDVFLAQSAVQQRTEFGWPQEMIDYVAKMHRSHDSASLATACQTVPDWIILSDFSPLAELSCPVCIIAWEDDPMHPLELAHRVAGALPNAHLEMLESIAVMFTHPEVVGQIYGRFLEGLS
ncbi:MAG: alpha/beta hydrolase [Chloroflexota bacterium]